MPSPFAIHFDKHLDDVTVLTVVGEIDMVTVPQLDEAMASVALTGPRDLVLDLANVTYMDSTGLRALVNGLRMAREQQVNLKLRNAPRVVRRLLHITQLWEEFEVE